MTSGDTCCAVGCLLLAHELDTEDLMIGLLCLGRDHMTMSRVYAIYWSLTVISLTDRSLFTLVPLRKICLQVRGTPLGTVTTVPVQKFEPTPSPVATSDKNQGSSLQKQLCNINKNIILYSFLSPRCHHGHHVPQISTHRTLLVSAKTKCSLRCSRTTHLDNKAALSTASLDNFTRWMACHS